MVSWVVGINAWSTISNFFDLTRPQQPPSERVPYISEKLDFWWSIPQKITSIGYFSASNDHTIRIRKFFEEIGLQRLLRLVRLQRPLRSMRLPRFLRPGKSLLRTSESSMFMNWIIWGLISLYFDVLKKIFFWQNHENSCWILAPYLSEAIEAAWGQKSFKWLIRHKFPLLRNPLSISFW